MRLTYRVIMGLIPVLMLASLLAYFTKSDIDMATFVSRVANTQLSNDDNWFHGLYWLNKFTELFKDLKMPDLSSTEGWLETLQLPSLMFKVPFYAICCLVFYTSDVLIFLLKIIAIFIPNLSFGE